MKIPVVIITGFLGSGKTSLIRRLLSQCQERDVRCAVIVNEFGSIGIDNLLLPVETKRIELPGGCLCCALLDDLETTLHEIISKSPDLDMVFIETTGLADPLPMAWTLHSEAIATFAYLFAVMTVVDPFEYDNFCKQSPSTQAQVRYADILLLSKMDREGAVDALAKIEPTLEADNPKAAKLSLLPDQQAHAVLDFLSDPWRSAAITSNNDAKQQIIHRDDDMEELSVRLSDTYDIESLSEALALLPASIIRIKGLIYGVDGRVDATKQRGFVIHRVGIRVSVDDYDGDSLSCAVAIGTNLDERAFLACFEQSVLNKA